jgi:hypothetical protein
MSKSVVVKIQAPKRVATVVFSCEKYAYDGSWEISGDSAITYLFDQEMKRPKVLYLPYSIDIDEKKGFPHLLSTARVVASRFDGASVSVSGEVVYPASDGSSEDKTVIY